MADENFLEAPVWPTDISTGTETDPAGQSGEGAGDDAGSGNGADGGDDRGGSDPKGGEDSGKSDPNDGERKPKVDAPADKTPQQPGVRKTKYDFIADRQRKKAEREAKANGQQQGDGEGDYQDDSNQVAPEDKETIRRVVNEEYRDQFEAVEQQRFDNEVNSFFQQDKAAKYATEEEKALLREYAVHPTRANIPLASIMLEVMGADRLMEIGAQIEREAAKKAGQSKSGGGSASRQDTPTGLPDYYAMSDKDFEAEQFKVMTGRR